MNILLIGHACSPGLGSEPGFTWNWAQQLSIHHPVWVVAHPQFRSLLWLPEAYRVGQQLVLQHSIDIAHHVSWGTLGAPPQARLAATRYDEQHFVANWRSLYAAMATGASLTGISASQSVRTLS